MAKKKVLVVGAGASGMMAAIAAARSGASVTLLEAMERPGRKLLLTGNGRCNITNTDKKLPEAYHGSGAPLARQIIRQFDASATLAFFEELGLLTAERSGYVYPYSGQSSSVLDVLLMELSRLGVKLKFNERIEDITASGESWLVRTATWTYQADAVIVSCGSKAAPATGSDGSGYTLAARLGHTLVDPSPALTPIICRGNFLAQLAGVRCRAEVSLMERAASSSKLLRRETGEVQWTKYGVSGIVIFQLSRFVSTCEEKKNLNLELDLMPDFSAEYLVKRLALRAPQMKQERANALLSGMLHEKLIPVVLQACGLPKKTTAGSLTERQLDDIVRTVKKFELEIIDTKSFDVCQVCAGGVDGSELSPRTLESLICKNLYFTGEIVDVDGPCGGYNLQWAWSSGYVAGAAAATSLPS